MALLEALLLISSLISTAFACNGYELKNLKIETCEGKNDVFGYDDFSAILNDDCKIVPTGCLVIKKDMNWGNGSYLVEKKVKMGMPMKFSGKKDLCNVLEKSKESPEVTLIFKLINLGQSCPMKAGKICGNGAVSVQKYRDQLKMAEGDFEGTIKGKSDAGDVCINIALSIVKKGGGGHSIPGMG
uniref:MD-2-related lipid-recognition domain-containing protein n=1 Tax=Homalodisca liturata TaxID=320908 RepID=A0A1B6I9S4_9HEMI